MRSSMSRVLLFVVGCLAANSSFESPYQKIDCHCHYIPPDYRTALQATGNSHPDGMPGIPSWSVDDHLHMMESINITKSILSISSPGTHLTPGDDASGRNLTSYVNKFASDLKKARPSDFGFWANLPLPDVQGSLAEISRAFDELDADGVAVLTNHHGVYLGDSKFDPVFKALNDRNATVFIHPTTPWLYENNSAPVMAAPLLQYPRPMFEFMFESARAVINLFLSGTVARSPNVTFIIAHMGGAFPPILRRFASIPALLHLNNTDPHISPAWVEERINAQFFFDSAGWPFPEQIQGLLDYVGVDRLVYGSDYCFTPAAGAQALSLDHDKYLPSIFPDPMDIEKLCSLNAEKLLEKD